MQEKCCLTSDLTSDVSSNLSVGRQINRCHAFPLCHRILIASSLNVFLDFQCFIITKSCTFICYKEIILYISMIDLTRQRRDDYQWLTAYLISRTRIRCNNIFIRILLHLILQRHFGATVTILRLCINAGRSVWSCCVRVPMLVNISCLCSCDDVAI